MMIHSPHQQRGATLVIALIMLVLLTLFALSAVNTSNTNLRIVGNMQDRNDAFDAAQLAIETVISNTFFASTPSNAVQFPCGTPNTLCFDVNGDNVKDFTVKLNPEPKCVYVKPIKLVELTYSVEDGKCSAGQSQSFGTMGTNTDDSLCANSVWEITAEAVSEATGAIVATIKQGIGIRLDKDLVPSCD